MKVSNVMTRNVSACSIDSDLESVARLMWDNDCGSVPVIDSSSQIVGVVTDRDIAMGCALNHKPEWELKTSDVLRDQSVHTCRSDEEVQNALSMMAKYHIRRLPVVNDQGQLQGMLSIGDVIALAQERNPELSYKDAMGMLKQVSAHH